MNETLNQLREIAGQATPGPWALWLDQDGAEHMNGMLMVGNEAAVIPEGETWVEGVDVNPIACVYTPEDRAHIVAFDPPTVLALIDRAEAAEAAVARVREVATAMATHSLPEAPRGGAWETAHGAQLFAKDILDALDGGE